MAKPDGCYSHPRWLAHGRPDEHRCGAPKPHRHARPASGAGGAGRKQRDQRNTHAATHAPRTRHLCDIVTKCQLAEWRTAKKRRTKECRTTANYRWAVRGGRNAPGVPGECGRAHRRPRGARRGAGRAMGGARGGPMARARHEQCHAGCGGLGRMGAAAHGGRQTRARTGGAIRTDDGGHQNNYYV